MNTHFTYFLILGASLAGPLALSFDRKVAFYRQWKFLFPAIILPALFYICWDIYFTARGVWSFNPTYTSGIYFVNLPFEEVLFFLVVPYCCIFIYACMGTYFPALQKLRWADFILQGIAIVLLVAGTIFHKRAYTCSAFLLCAFFIGCIYTFKGLFTNFKAGLFLLSFLVILVPFLVVNGFLTAMPVVLYNDAENLGLRIYTIPFEDVFYGMLLVMMNVALFEIFRTAGRRHT
jgi:lycopene cyclase domain-containing protein